MYSVSRLAFAAAVTFIISEIYAGVVEAIDIIEVHVSWLAFDMPVMVVVVVVVVVCSKGLAIIAFVLYLLN